MARGITQDQVNAAADVLVTAGERPTVEKVRAQLGTGSPNTVTRMLETWRGGLAMRLSQVLALPEAPTEVGQAFTEVWRLAMGHARSLAEASLSQDRNALLAAETALAQERKIWEISVAEAHELAKGAEQSREVAETRLADMQRLVEQQAGQVAELIQQRGGLQQRVDQLSQAFEALKSSLAAERDAQALHLKTVEDRSHAEVDRARGETKALQATLRHKERDASTIASRLEAAVAALRGTEHLAKEQRARANTLEQQLARMDGVPAALLAAQRSLQAALRRETLLQAKLGRLMASIKLDAGVRVRKSRKAAGAS